MGKAAYRLMIAVISFSLTLGSWTDLPGSSSTIFPRPLFYLTTSTAPNLSTVVPPVKVFLAVIIKVSLHLADPAI